MSLKTDFFELDEAIGELNEKELIVFAGSPGVRKSSLALTIITCVCKYTFDKVLYYNLETSKEVLSPRVNSNVIITDKPNISTEDIRKQCEEVSKDDKLALIVIDYLQLMSGSDVEKTIAELKSIAEDYNVPVLLLSQLSKPELREDPRPMLKDLKIPTELVDKVVLLYRHLIDPDRLGMIVAKKFDDTNPIYIEND